MTGLRVMPLLGRENDARGRFRDWPGPDSHAAHRICADTAASYASAARPDVARRADEADMGATPPADALVMAWGHACFHTLCPRRGRSRSWIPTEGCSSAAATAADQRICPASGYLVLPASRKSLSPSRKAEGEPKSWLVGTGQFVRRVMPQPADPVGRTSTGASRQPAARRH